MHIARPHLRITAIGIPLVFIAASLRAQTVETERFRVALRDGGALEVMDKSANATWVQPSSGASVSAAEARDGELIFRLNEAFEATVSVGESSIDLTLRGDPDSSIENLQYPAAFRLASGGDEQRFVLPNCGGLSIPFRLRDEPYLRPALGMYEACISQRGLMMPWVGVTAGAAASMMLITTPFDCRVNVSTDDEGYVAAAAWRDSMGKMAYERGVRFYFVPSGGHVALCKEYRQYAKDTGLFVSLREKSVKAPQLERFIGAMSLWVSDWPDIGLFERMKADGLEKLLISFHASENVPLEASGQPGRNATYEPMTKDFVGKLHDLGLLAGRYDYYRTIFPPTDTGAGGNAWIMRMTGYPEQAARDAQGKLIPGFGERAAAGDELIRGHRCSKCQYEMARVYIPLDVERNDYDGRLIDAVCAVEWMECHSPDHPTTRIQDMEYRLQELKVATDCGQITGTEHLSSWAVPVTVYGEGPSSFVRFYRTGSAVRLRPVPLEMPDEFRLTVLNEEIRAPLWQLVFHDATVITNRWNITPNRYVDPADWDKEDLMNLLHGQMPTILLNQDDYAKNAQRLVKTFQTVCDWNGEIGYEEMTDHRWLDAAGKVQQTVYESGKGVVVNFGAEEFVMADGSRVPAGGYLKTMDDAN